MQNELPHFLTSLFSAIIHAAPRVITGIIIFILFYLLGILIKFLIIHFSNHTKYRKPLYILLGKISKLFIILVGLISGLGTMGVNVSALVASLGLTGFALGFALKDILSNVLAGFLVLFYRPFKEGNQIAVNNTEGRVIDINLRYTVLKSDSQETLIPNAMILSSPVNVKLEQEPREPEN